MLVNHPTKTIQIIQDPEYWKKENEHFRKLRKLNQMTMNASELHEKGLCREKKKVKKNSPLKVKVFKTTQSHDKHLQVYPRFTFARYVNQEVSCHLFVLDNYEKDKMQY